MVGQLFRQSCLETPALDIAVQRDTEFGEKPEALAQRKRFVVARSFLVVSENETLSDLNYIELDAIDPKRSCAGEGRPRVRHLQRSGARVPNYLHRKKSDRVSIDWDYSPIPQRDSNNRYRRDLSELARRAPERARRRGASGVLNSAQEILDESNSNAQDPQELVPGFVRCSPNGTAPISEGSLRGSFVAILTRLISKRSEIGALRLADGCATASRGCERVDARP
jgi:hypothetical protein